MSEFLFNNMLLTVNATQVLHAVADGFVGKLQK